MLDNTVLTYLGKYAPASTQDGSRQPSEARLHYQALAYLITFLKAILDFFIMSRFSFSLFTD